MLWLGGLKCPCPLEHAVHCNLPLIEKKGFAKDEPIFDCSN